MRQGLFPSPAGAVAVREIREAGIEQGLEDLDDPPLHDSVPNILDLEDAVTAPRSLGDAYLSVRPGAIAPRSDLVADGPRQLPSVPIVQVGEPLAVGAGGGSAVGVEVLDGAPEVAFVARAAEKAAGELPLLLPCFPRGVGRLDLVAAQVVSIRPPVGVRRYLAVTGPGGLRASPPAEAVVYGPPPRIGREPEGSRCQDCPGGLPASSDEDSIGSAGQESATERFRG